MGYFSEVEQELRDRAVELGDQCGEREDVVKQLCSEFNLENEEVLEILQGDYDDPYDYDDSMDGDHESALASCGWGTSEDYGGYADEAY